MLKLINSIPFSLTIKHFYTSSVLVKAINSPEEWDILRTFDEVYTIPEDRNEWLRAVEGQLSRSKGDIKKDGHTGSLIPLSKNVVQFIKENNFTKVFSVGVGGAGLEYQIKKQIPEIQIICSEYAPKSVEMLKKVFIEANSIIQFDIKDKWEKMSDDTLVLMYRVDPHLTDEEWKKLFRDIPAKNILFIPNTFLTVKSLISRLLSRVKQFNKIFVFSGYLRTKKCFISLWKKSFYYKEIKMYGYTGFHLIKK